jgi:hypothetical protein
MDGAEKDDSGLISTLGRSGGSIDTKSCFYEPFVSIGFLLVLVNHEIRLFR